MPIFLAHLNNILMLRLQILQGRKEKLPVTSRAELMTEAGFVVLNTKTIFNESQVGNLSHFLGPETGQTLDWTF